GLPFGDHVADLDLDLPHGAGDVRGDVRHGCAVLSFRPGRQGRACSSRNFVSSVPAANAGSATMRRWSGMLVLIPSTVNASSAARERAMASARSRPETISLAIIGS